MTSDDDGLAAASGVQHSRSNSSLSGNKSPLSRTASSSGIGSPLMARTNSSRGLRFQDSAGGTFGTAPHPTFMGELEAVCPVGSYEKDIDPMTSPLQRKDSFSFKTVCAVMRVPSQRKLHRER